MLRHRAGLAHLKGVGKDEVLDHLAMEARLAAALVERAGDEVPQGRVRPVGLVEPVLGRMVRGQGPDPEILIKSR